MNRKILNHVFLNAAGDAGGAGGGGAAPAPAAPAAGAAPAAAPVPAAGEDWKAMTNEQFNARLAREREAGTKELLRSLGFDKPEDAKARIAAAKALEDAQKTEAQKTAERVAALEPRARLADEYEKTIKGYAETEFKALPPEAQKLVEAQAGEDAHARLTAINNLRSSGVLAKLGAPAAPAPITTRAGGTPPPAAPTGKKHPRDMTPSERKAYEAELLAQHT